MEESNEQILDTTSDASEETSSESPSTESSQGEESAKAASSEQTTTDSANLPFHEHPRFKELVEQKNQALAASKALEERYAQMEAQLKQLSSAPKSQTEAQKDELIEHLKTIDPRFAARMEQLTKNASMVEQLQEKLQNYEQQQFRTQAVAQVNSLHDQNKVTPELKTFINNQLESLAMAGKIQNIQDIPRAYKDIHDQYSKFIDGIKRAERESYVAAKKADNKAPTSQPRGKPVSHAPSKQSFSKDPEVAKQQIVSRYLKTAKAEADI